MEIGKLSRVYDQYSDGRQRVQSLLQYCGKNLLDSIDGQEEERKHFALLTKYTVAEINEDILPRTFLQRIYYAIAAVFGYRMNFMEYDTSSMTLEQFDQMLDNPKILAEMMKKALDVIDYQLFTRDAYTLEIDNKRFGPNEKEYNSIIALYGYLEEKYSDRKELLKVLFSMNEQLTARAGGVDFLYLLGDIETIFPKQARGMHISFSTSTGCITSKNFFRLHDFKNDMSLIADNVMVVQTHNLRTHRVSAEIVYQ